MYELLYWLLTELLVLFAASLVILIPFIGGIIARRYYNRPIFWVIWGSLMTGNIIFMFKELGLGVVLYAIVIPLVLGIFFRTVSKKLSYLLMVQLFLIILFILGWMILTPLLIMIVMTTAAFFICSKPKGGEEINTENFEEGVEKCTTQMK